MSHNLVKDSSGWKCTVCRRWWRSKSTSRCAGIRYYEWGHVPDTLAPKGKLFEMGLILAEGQQRVAVAGQNWEPLYSVEEAVPHNMELDFKTGHINGTKYAIQYTPDGFTIWRINGLNAVIRYKDTYLMVNQTPHGVYQWKEALQTAALHFIDELRPDANKGDREEGAEMIRNAIARKFYAGWQRLISEIIPSQISELARLMWASTQTDAAVLHNPELYTEDYKHVYADLKKYHACRLYAANLIREELPKLAQWREALTPTVPNKALNKTLDKLPPAISYKQIIRLSTIRLEQPITNRLHLVFILCASDHHNWGLHERTVVTATPDMIKQVGLLMGTPLKTQSRTTLIDRVARQILDYPEAYNGDLSGLARRSHEWHQQFDHIGDSTLLPADTPLVMPQSVDLVELEKKGITILKTAGDCYEEHHRLHNCIHTYASKAAKGQCYLFHVSYKVEDKHYMAAVEVAPDGRIVQAEGPENQKNPACRIGVEELSKAFQREVAL